MTRWGHSKYVTLRGGGVGASVTQCDTGGELQCCYVMHRVTSRPNDQFSKLLKLVTSTSVKENDVYPHMPIRRPHAARYIGNVFNFHERRSLSVKFTSAHLNGNVYMRVGVVRALADSSDFGLLGEQSSQKFVIPCLGRQ